MDLLSKILVSIDAIKEQLASFSKKNAEDYYELVSPVGSDAFKMNDGTVISFYELKGLGRILEDHEKRALSKKIENDLRGFLSFPGYNIQIVDSADPSMTHHFVSESMSESIEELKRMGLGHRLITSDYVDFIAKNSVWRKQYVVLYTTPLSIKSDSASKSEKKASIKIDDEMKEKSAIIDNVMKTSVDEQVAVQSPLEKIILKNHKSFDSLVLRSFSRAGIILNKINVDDAVREQKRLIYGVADLSDWAPTFNYAAISKSPESDVTKGRVRVETSNLAEQVLDQGGSEKDMPHGVFRFGDRFFTTISMTIPQQNEEKLSTYQAILSMLPKRAGVLTSFRMTSSPYSFSSYNTEQIYTGISAVFPGSGNRVIREARSELKRQHDDNEKVSVYLELTLTFFEKNVETLIEHKNLVMKSLSSWNNAKFRVVELDKTQGLFDSLPGASKQSKLKQTMENFADALYQSPVFGTGLIYDSGYLHLFTDDNQPYPIEEHSSKNMNYNSYICGTPGSGKSTVLAILNLALLAKPKNNPKLRGELPVLMDVDFGKTSFGTKKLLKHMAGKEKEHLFLVHEMGSGVDSAINPHDLPMGRYEPTSRHKEILVRFLMALIGGVHEDKTSGMFKFNEPELEGMISSLVTSVYSMCKEDYKPKMFHPAEFRHKSTIEFLKSIGIEPNKNYSYYGLADLVMEKSPKKGADHALLLRRYAVPRLADYSPLIIDNPQIADKFKEGSMGGKSPITFFLDKLSQALNEYPCFSRPTVISIDKARMISIDIDAVCGESDNRKAIFGSLMLMMFFSKRENIEESKDLLDGVKPQHLPYLKRMDLINRVLPGTLNIEEAHMLFSLFDSLLITAQRRNRKRGWGIRSLSQGLMDPSDKLFSMTSSVYIATEETGKKVDERLNSIQASNAEKRIVNKGLPGRNIFLYIRTKGDDGDDSKAAVSRVGVRLNTKISPGLLWFSNSEQVDIGFRDDVFEKIGYEEGLVRLSLFFKSGSVRKLFESQSLKRIAKKRGFDSVYSLLLDAISKGDKPDPELASEL